MAPLIGITCYPPNTDGHLFLPDAYVAALRRAGADVVLVPAHPAPGVAAAEPAIDADDRHRRVGRLLDRLDGLVLAGGGDLDPALYGGSSHETVYATDAGRDADEIALVHGSLEAGTPTLAICRGSQVVNVALGGSLVAHLPDLDSAGLAHRIEPEILRGMPAPTPHDVVVEDGSLVARLMGTTTVAPMSWHHQAIDRLGDGLRVVGRAPDGTIEATEHDAHPFLISVQWHPELTAVQDRTQQALFDALVQRCRERIGGSQEQAR